MNGQWIDMALVSVCMLTVLAAIATILVWYVS